MKALFLLFIVAALLTLASAIELELPKMEQKCLGQYGEVGEVVSLSFEVFGRGGSKRNGVETTIINPLGQSIYSKKEQTGKYTFTANDHGNYRICFKNTQYAVFNVKFRFDVGIIAKDYSKVAKKDNLKPVEVELRRIEDITTGIMEELTYMKYRHDDMTKTNESISYRVFSFAIFSTIALMGLSVVQLIYLHAFFRKKQICD